MTRPDARRSLLDRIEGRLSGHAIREVAMFGAIAVMVDEAMLVAVNRDHSLLVRVAPDDDALLLDREDATRAEMGAGRSMGPGWIRVHADSIADDATLDLWLHHALGRRRATESGRLE